ncbi:unnamed protein product [Phytophthora lilii]|uniref:Unnamed protein product n=1 Tax=Phytophthora lilii TaxID=2077276 RepID=A0A9W6X2K9_9STRA|nr:unnamed protein product [Phytophthora lilii]
MPNNREMSEFSLSADLAGLLSNENHGAEFPSAHFTAEPRHSSQGMLNRAHSLEPPDLDLQLLGTSDDELDEGFPPNRSHSLEPPDLDLQLLGTSDDELDEGLNRAHSLEPPDLDLQLLGTSDDKLDEGFQAALQFLNESQDVDILEEVLLQPQATTFPTGNVDTSSTSASDPEDSGINASKAARSSQASTSSKPKRRHRVSTKQQIENLRGTVETLKTNYATSQASEDSSTTVMSKKPM